MINNMNNLKLLEYCLKNKEGFLDPYYIFQKKHLKLDLYIEQTKKIKNLLITIKELKKRNTSELILKNLYFDLAKLLNDYANFSEFCCFINACDSQKDEVKNNVVLLKKITDLYLEERDLNEIVPAEWIQALIDKTSSRKKGHVGEEKLIDILSSQLGFIITKDISEFVANKKSVARFSRSGDFSNLAINKQFGISLGKKTQNKKLDLIIKNNKDIYFLEAKHISNEGGEQNKQILELIEIIDIKPPKENYHFVSFLDGVYFNKLFNSTQQKLENQRNDIRKYLGKNKENYFINTAGFKKLFV